MTRSPITEVHGHEMREQLIDILLDALSRQGFPDISRNSLRTVPAHRAAFRAMLEDCRPLPVVREVIRDIDEGRL